MLYQSILQKPSPYWSAVSGPGVPGTFTFALSWGQLLDGLTEIRAKGTTKVPLPEEVLRWDLPTFGAALGIAQLGLVYDYYRCYGWPKASSWGDSEFD